MNRVAELTVEATHGRGGVFDSVVIALVKAGVANTGQVTHVTDLITEQVGRATGGLERAVKTTHTHLTEVTAKTDEGIAGSECGAAVIAAAGRKIDLLLDLEECSQAGVDFMIAFKAQAGGVAGQVGLGVVSTIIQIINGYVCTTVDAHFGHSQGRHDGSGANNNGNQLFLHRKTPSDLVNVILG